MIVKRDLLFPSLVQKRGMVTREQLDECLTLLRESRYLKSLGRVLVEKGYLAVGAVSEILAEQKRELLAAASIHPSAGSGEATLFGAVAVMKGYVTLEQVKECVQEQQRLIRLGIRLRLGEILVSHSYITTDEVLNVLKLQHMHLLVCTVCNRRFNVVTFSSKKDFTCRLCGGRLVEPQALESVSVDDRIEEDESL